MPEIVVQTIGLNKHFGSVNAVKDLSMDIYAGEIFAFLGPNGAGKTTSINMMCGLLKPDRGEVLIQGKPISVDSSSIRSRIGVCPQEIILWERLTCIEQLCFIGQMYGMSKQAAQRNGDSLLGKLGLIEKRNHQAHTLSGGMQRRLNLAMALVHDPEIVVLDEPEAGLDPQSRVCVREYIRSLSSTKTVIFTTHNMDEADRIADRIAIIDHGELLVLDTPEEIKHRAGRGDVIEISLNSPHGNFERFFSNLPDGVGCEYDDVRNSITLHAMNAIGELPIILGTLSKDGFDAGEVHIRANTLEDAFIQLTGRSLRE